MVLNQPLALWVSPVGDMGGVARHLIDVARTGIPGYRLVFLTPPGRLADTLTDLGVAVLTRPFGPEAGVKKSVAVLRGIIKKLRPQLVHTHLSYADIIASIATIGLPVKLVTTEHGIAANDLVYHASVAKSKVMALVHTARMRRFDAAIAVSKATKDAMIAKWHPRCPVTVIYNGIDTPTTPAHPSQGLKIASVARLSPEKRIDALISAFGALVERHPQARLTIAGEGPLLAELEDQARPLGERVRFVGYHPGDEVLADTDVLVQLSVWENCSYTLLDAMAHRCGVVATPVGGNPELLPPNCLVEADDRAGLVQAIEDQGRELSSRPQLDGWVSVSQMCAQIGNVYMCAISPFGETGHSGAK